MQLESALSTRGVPQVTPFMFLDPTYLVPYSVLWLTDLFFSTFQELAQDRKD